MKPAHYEIIKFYIKMYSVVGVESVDEAPVDEAPVDETPIGLYTKLRKTRTFEMDVMQKLQIGKLSSLAHIISTYGSL